MAISFIAAGTPAATTGGGSGTVTPGMPAGFAADDLLVIFATQRGTATFTTPTNYTLRQQFNHASSGLNHIAVFFKIADGSETDPAVSWTGGAANATVIAQVAAFRGVDTTTPFVEDGTASSNASAANIGPIAGISIAANNAVLVFGHRADDWTSVALLTGDGLTWTEIGEPDSTSGTDAGEVWDIGISTIATTVADKTFTVSGGAAQTGLGIMMEIAVSSGTQFTQTVTGGLTFSSAFVKDGRKVSTGGLTFSSAFTKQAGRVLSGGLTFAGSVAKEDQKPVSGGLTFTSVFSKLAQHALSGGLTFSGDFTKTILKSFTGALTFIGTLTTSIIFTIAFTAALTFSTAFTKQIEKVIAGSLTFVGTVTKRSEQVIIASLTFSGAFVKTTQKAFTSSLSFASMFVKEGQKTLAATLTLSVSFTAEKVGQLFTIALTAALTFSSVFTKQTEKVIAGGLNFNGVIAKTALKVVTGSLTFVGDITKQISRALTGGLTFVGTVVGNKLIFVTLTAGLTFVGSMTKQSEKALAAALSFVGTILQKKTIRAGTPFLFTSANWGTQSFYLEVFMRATTGTAEAELYNITDGVTVVNSEISTSSTSLVRLRSAAFSLVDGKEYRVQLLRLGPDGGAILGARLIAFQ